MGSDFGEVALACATGELEGTKLEWRPEACVSVVLASQGYPGSYPTGEPIEGLDVASGMDDVVVFHAGTASEGDRVVTAGGRVLCVSALGATFKDARKRAYEATGAISFAGKYLRTDIAKRAETAEASS
jgi:phosphoribosylamine--glycine ligase